MSDIVETLALLGSNEWTADLATVSAVAREAKAEIERLRGQVEQLTADNEKLLMMLRGSGQPRNSQIPSTGREEP